MSATAMAALSSSSATAPSTSTSAASTSASSASGPQVWLLKLPTFVAEQFKRSAQQPQATAASSSATPAPLGHLEVSYTPDGRQQLTFRYNPSDPTQPRDFTVKPRVKRPMLVFTEKQPATTSASTTTSGASSTASSSASSSTAASPAASAPPLCKFLSPVTLLADVVPPDTPLYRQFLTRRTASHQSQSNTQRMVEGNSMFITPQVQAEMERKRRREEEKKEGRGEDGEGGAGGMRGKRKEGKRVRGERAEVESLLLRLFSESRWLSLKQLVEGTQQPLNFLKEVMTDMCVRETKGENKDKYQLKEKYRIDE